MPPIFVVFKLSISYSKDLLPDLLMSCWNKAPQTHRSVRWAIPDPSPTLSNALPPARQMTLEGVCAPTSLLKIVSFSSILMLSLRAIANQIRKRRRRCLHWIYCGISSQPASRSHPNLVKCFRTFFSGRFCRQMLRRNRQCFTDLCIWCDLLVSEASHGVRSVVLLAFPSSKIARLPEFAFDARWKAEAVAALYRRVHWVSLDLRLKSSRIYNEPPFFQIPGAPQRVVRWTSVQRCIRRQGSRHLPFVQQLVLRRRNQDGALKQPLPFNFFLFFI